MARAARKTETKTLERKLWDAADALRGNQEPSEYKHVVLGLVFLKYISDRFEGRRKEIEAELIARRASSPIRCERLVEDRDEYTSHKVFWVPAAARWGIIQKSAKQPEIGESIDNAMDLIEKREPQVARRTTPQLRPRRPRQGTTRPACRHHRFDRLHGERRPRVRRRSRPRL